MMNARESSASNFGKVLLRSSTVCHFDPFCALVWERILCVPSGLSPFGLIMDSFAICAGPILKLTGVASPRQSR